MNDPEIWISLNKLESLYKQKLGLEKLPSAYQTAMAYCTVHVRSLINDLSLCTGWSKWDSMLSHLQKFKQRVWISLQCQFIFSTLYIHEVALIAATMFSQCSLNLSMDRKIHVGYFPKRVRSQEEIAASTNAKKGN